MGWRRITAWKAKANGQHTSHGKNFSSKVPVGRTSDISFHQRASSTSLIKSVGKSAGPDIGL